MKIEAGLHDVADFSPLPAGEYEFIIKDPMDIVPVVDERSDIGGKVYNFVVYAEVASGEHAGKRVRRGFTNRSKATRYFLRTFLDRIGVSIEGSGSFNSEDLLGRRFKANVSERSYTDQNGNERKAADLDVESIVGL